MKNLKTILKSLTISSIICISMVNPNYAQAMNNLNALIEIEHYQQPSGGWQPGDSREIKFAIKNNTSKKMTVSKIYMIEKSRITLDEAFDEMAQNTWITIKDGNETIKESISLKEFLASDSNNSVSALDNYVRLSPGQIKELTMSIDMKEEMGNPAQSLSKVFRLGTVYTLTPIGGGIIVDPEKPIDPDGPIDPEDPDGGEAIEPEKPNSDNGGNSSSDNDQNNSSDIGGSEDKLPQTGGMVNGATLTALGVVVAGLGIALDRKSSDKGGKSDE